MDSFKTALLREKFTVQPHDKDGNRAGKSVQAYSNRMALELHAEDGTLEETFVIRTQNMHTCIRLTAVLLQEYNLSGSILNKPSPYNWERSWNTIIQDYELISNPNIWAAIYNDGRVIFESGERHTLVDMIEKFAAENPGNYDHAIKAAEASFRKKLNSHTVLDHEGTFALVFNAENSEARCSIMLRRASRSMTLSFSIKSLSGGTPNHYQALLAASALLEGIQLAFVVGAGREKKRHGLMRDKEKAEQLENAETRLRELDAQVTRFEKMFIVNYRPERPNFKRIIAEAEEVTRQVLTAGED